MKKLLGLVCLAALCFGQDKKSAASSEVVALKQLERDWNDAQKSKDVEKLNLIIGDDWIGVGYDGNKSNKQDFIRDVKSSSSKLESFEFGDIDVKLMGNVAVVQGGDTEKSSTHGEDSSGKWVWTDVFVKRDGRWQAVRSQSAKVK